MSNNPNLQDFEKWWIAAKAIEGFTSKDSKFIVSVTTHDACICLIKKVDNNMWAVMLEEGIEQSVYACSRTLADAVREFINYNVLSNQQTTAVHNHLVCNVQRCVYITHDPVSYHCEQKCRFVVNPFSTHSVGMSEVLRMMKTDRWCTRCETNELKVLSELWCAAEPALNGKVLSKKDGTLYYKDSDV